MVIPLFRLHIFAALVMLVAMAFWPGVGFADAGKEVLSLDPAGFAAGRTDRLAVVGSTSRGVDIVTPIVVIKGAKPGKTLLLTAAVHGDELNGIRVLHLLAGRLDSAQLAGTVVMVPGVNGPGMAAHSRYFVESDGGGALVDLNRQFPGDADGSLAQRVAARLWQMFRSAKPDLAVDLHTQTRGTVYPLFVYADFNNPVVADMARDLMPDLIKRDTGESGTLETELLRTGVPSLTYEIGAPKIFEPDLIHRAVAGLENVMRRHAMLAGPLVQPASTPFIGNRFFTVRAEQGGVSVVDVALLDIVAQDDLLARQFDLFGHEVRQYRAPVGGRVVSISTDPLREPGAPLVRILY